MATQTAADDDVLEDSLLLFGALHLHASWTMRFGDLVLLRLSLVEQSTSGIFASLSGSIGNRSRNDLTLALWTPSDSEI